MKIRSDKSRCEKQEELHEDRETAVHGARRRDRDAVTIHRLTLCNSMARSGNQKAGSARRFHCEQTIHGDVVDLLFDMRGGVVTCARASLLSDKFSACGKKPTGQRWPGDSFGAMYGNRSDEHACWGTE